MSNHTAILDYESHNRRLPHTVGKRQLLTVFGILVILLTGMEIKARQDDYPTNYDPTTDLWVAQWLELENSLPPDQTVAIGASRMQYGMLIPEWKKLTGKDLHMLAFPASPPDMVLEKLAELESFRGTVLCGFAPAFAFAHDDSPTRNGMNSNLAAVEPSRYSLTHHLKIAADDFLLPRCKFMNNLAYSPVLLSYVYWPFANRSGLKIPFIWPWDGSLDRKLQWRFPHNIHEVLQWEIVNQLQDSSRRIVSHFGTESRDELVKRYKTAVSKIENRGGKVIFIRPPSDGKFLAHERKHNARQDFYDPIVEATGCFGIHFEDYPELEELQCVEDSHLDVDDARKFTRRVVNILVNNGIIEPKQNQSDVSSPAGQGS